MKFDDLIEAYFIKKHILDQCNIKIKYVCISRKTVYDAIQEWGYSSPFQSMNNEENDYTFCGVKIVQVLEDNHFSIGI